MQAKQWGELTVLESSAYLLRERKKETYGHLRLGIILYIPYRD